LKDLAMEVVGERSNWSYSSAVAANSSTGMLYYPYDVDQMAAAGTVASNWEIYCDGSQYPLGQADEHVCRPVIAALDSQSCHPARRDLVQKPEKLTGRRDPVRSDSMMIARGMTQILLLDLLEAAEEDTGRRWWADEQLLVDMCLAAGIDTCSLARWLDVVERQRQGEVLRICECWEDSSLPRFLCPRPYVRVHEMLAQYR